MLISDMVYNGFLCIYFANAEIMIIAYSTYSHVRHKTTLNFGLKGFRVPQGKPNFTGFIMLQAV